jgi:histone-lysine N-methyltransferase MLL3
MFGRFGYFKLGLRGGSPMWSTGAGYGRGGRRNDSTSNDEKRGSSSGSNQERDVGESASGSKVESQAESKAARQSYSSGRETRGGVITPARSVAVVSTVASLVCVDYNDFDDENSHTPPLTPPLPQDDRHRVTSGSLPVAGKAENVPAVPERVSEQDLASTEKLQESSNETPSNQDEVEHEISNNAKELIEGKCGEEIEVAVVSQEDILGSDTVVSSDLPVESLGVEETDCGNVVVFEHLSESDLAQVSSSIDTDIIEECIVTSSDIVMDISVVDALESCEKLASCIQKDDDEVLHLVEEENKAETGDVDDGLGGIELAEGGDDMPNMDMDVMHILDTGVRGVLDRDPVLDMPEGCREIHSMNERLRIGIVRSLGPLQQEKIVAMTDTPESPDQEEMNVDPSPEPYLPTPDTIKDDEDDMMPMIHDDPDMMELDETGGTEIDNDVSETDAAEMNVTGSAEVPAGGSTASVDTAGDSSGGALSIHTGSGAEAGKRDHPFGVPQATQLPPSSVHQANIGVPGSTSTVFTYPTFRSLAVCTANYARGEHLLNEEQSGASVTTVAATSAVITSAVTGQVTSVVTSPVSVPCTMPFSLDSESEASRVSAAKEKTEESSQIPSTSCLTSLSVASAVVTKGADITVSSEAGLIMSDCSTTVAHIPQSIIGVSPTFSIIKSSSPRRTSLLQGSSGSSTVPVCIIRSQSGGSANANSTTVSIISSAVASTVTSSQLTSATVASLVADAMSAARLPYPPASVGHQLPFTKTGVVPVMTVSPAGVSVIANASSVSRESESLVPPPRMSTAPVTSSLSVSPNVPVTVETNCPSIPVVESDQSSDEYQTNAVQNSSPANIQASVERKSVDIAAASRTSAPQKGDTETVNDATSKLSQVTRPSTLEATNQNLVSELPLQSLETEISSVQVIQKPLVKVDVDDGDEILMKTVQLIFQESRPSVLATADRASSFPSQCDSVAVQEETVAPEVGSSKWQHHTPVDKGASSSEIQQSVPVFNPSVTDTDSKKDLTITEKLLHQYSLPFSSTMSAEPDKSEQTKLDYDNSDKSLEIPTQTNAADTQNMLSTSQIQHSTNLKVPLKAFDSAMPSQTQVLDAAMPSQTQTFSDGVGAPVTAVFSQAAVCATAVETTLCGQSGAASIQPCGQSMLESRLTTGAQQMAGRVVAAPVPSPSVVMTSRLSSTIMSTGQAAASAVKQYVAYTQQQAVSQTSPVIAGVSKSSAVVRSLSPQLMTQSAPRLSTQSSTNVLAPSLATEQSVQSSVLPSGVLESQSSETIQQTQVSVPLVAVQRTASYGGSIRTASGDICVQEPVEAVSLSGTLGGDVPISVCSESVASSGDSVVDSSKCTTTLGYPYASSAPPRIQSSSSVYTRVMQPQRRMSTGEMKPEEPARSCQFEQVATVKTETSGSCLLNETPVPTTGFTMQQQQQATAVVTAISKPVSASAMVVSRTPVAAVTPKTEAQHLASSCKFSLTTQVPTLPLPHRIEESQNVLLKQLLQNTGCAQQTSVSSHHQGLPVVPSLEAQLARPVPPTPSSLLPSLLTNDSPLSQPPKNSQMSRPSQITAHETSFISRPSPPVSTSPSTPFVCQPQQTSFSERRPGPPSRTPSREDVLSPPALSTPRVSASGADSNHHTPSPLTSPPSVMIKKETVPPQQSPVPPVSSGDVKKEIVSDDSAVPLASEKREFNGKIEQPSRDDMGDLGMETEKTMQDQAALGKCHQNVICWL